jgi:hypothetical protein
VIEETKMPAVGETWYSDTYSNTWGELTVVGVIGDMVNCRSGGGVTVQPGKTGMFFRSALSRRIRPAPEATEGPEWKVGDRVYARPYYPTDALEARGTIVALRSLDSGDDADRYAVVDFDEVQSFGVRDWACLKTTLRRLSTPPSVPEPAWTGTDATKEWLHGKSPEPVATPTPKPDPYLQHGIEQNLPGDHRIAQMMAERDARLAKRRRFTADTLDSFGRNDLDRPMLKLGGRFGRVVESGHPRGWPEGSDHE